jgi:hypothetical protein
MFSFLFPGSLQCAVPNVYRLVLADFILRLIKSTQIYLSFNYKVFQVFCKVSSEDMQKEVNSDPARVPKEVCDRDQVANCPWTVSGRPGGEISLVNPLLLVKVFDTSPGLFSLNSKKFKKGKPDFRLETFGTIYRNTQASFSFLYLLICPLVQVALQ